MNNIINEFDGMNINQIRLCRCILFDLFMLMGETLSEYDRIDVSLELWKIEGLIKYFNNYVK